MGVGLDRADIDPPGPARAAVAHSIFAQGGAPDARRRAAPRYWLLRPAGCAGRLRPHEPPPGRLVPVLAALWLVLAVAGPAFAHAELASSDPDDKAVLATPPTVITLTFTEGLDQGKSSFKLSGPDGAAGTGNAAEDGSKVMTLDGLDLGPGAYAIKWTAASTDGHVSRGTLSFTVSEPTPAPATASPAPTAAPTDSATPRRAAIRHSPVRSQSTATPVATPGAGNDASCRHRDPPPTSSFPSSWAWCSSAASGRSSCAGAAGPEGCGQPEPSPRLLARLAGVAAAAAVMLGGPVVALAHGLSPAYQSPLPLAVYLAGAAATVALSFAFVLARDVRAGASGTRPGRPGADGRAVRPAGRRPPRLGVDHGPGHRRRLVGRGGRGPVPVGLRLGRRRDPVRPRVPRLGVARPVRHAPRRRRMDRCAASACAGGSHPRCRAGPGCGPPSPGSPSSSGWSSSPSRAARS